MLLGKMVSVFFFFLIISRFIIFASIVAFVHVQKTRMEQVKFKAHSSVSTGTQAK